MQKKHALVIEDDPSTAHLFQSLLSNFNFSPSVVSSLKEARKAIQAHTYELALVDLHLPDGKGEEIIVELREIGTFKLVVATSAILKDLENESAQRSGAHAFLAKPFSYSSFYALLTEHEIIDVVLPVREIESDALRAVMLEYVDSLDEQVKELRHAVEGGDFRSVAKLSHRMSSGALFGFPELAKICRSIHNAANQADASGVRAGYAAIEGLIPKIKAGSRL